MQQVAALSDDPVRLLTECNLSVYQQGKKIEGNITDKSVIYCPFNTTLQSDEIITGQTEFQRLDMFNDILQFKTQVREANRQYEFNYNGEVDNGMLIAAAVTTEDRSQIQQVEQVLGKKQPLQILISVGEMNVPQVPMVSAQSLASEADSIVVVNDMIQFDTHKLIAGQQ